MIPRAWFPAGLLFLAVTAGAIDPKGLVRQGHVSDFAGVFAPEQRAALEQQLVAAWQRSSNTIAVATLRTLEGTPVEDFATRLFEHWGLGQQGSDCGVLLLAAIEDRKVRIEVGYGLEGRIPDARAGRMLDEVVLPLFREGRFADGLERGALSLVRLAAGEDDGSAATNAPAASGPGSTSPPWIGIAIFFGFVAFIILLGALAKRKGWSGGSGGSSSSGWRSSGGSSSSSSGGFSGGRSGGGGASRGW